MIPHVARFGIYLNPGEHKIVRINSPYWFPEEPEWVYVTDEVNATLLRVRDIVREKALVPDAGPIIWGRIPLKE